MIRTAAKRILPRNAPKEWALPTRIAQKGNSGKVRASNSFAADGATSGCPTERSMGVALPEIRDNALPEARLLKGTVIPGSSETRGLSSQRC